MKDVAAEPASRPETSPRDPGERARIREGVLYCLKVFIGLRVGLFLLSLVGTGVLRALPPVSVPGWPARRGDRGLDILFTAWERQDALWFLRIAEGGYASGDGSAAFFPLYPLVVRGVSWAIGGHPLAASLIVSHLAALGALIVLYFLASSELSASAARRSVLYVAVFPTSFFLLAPYSESLFLLLSVIAFWAARRGRWPVAGLAGALASGTRSIGVLMAPVLAVEAVHQWREGRGRPHRPGLRQTLAWKLGWSAAAVGGLVAYLAFWQQKAGDWLAPVSRQQNWSREAEAPWTSVVQATKSAFCCLGQFSGGYHLVDWLVVVPCILLAGYALVRLRPVYGLYAWGSILLPLSVVWPERPFMSMPRFLAVVFPLFLALAVLVERRRVPHNLVVGLFGAGLGALSILFVNWYYIF